MVKKKVILKDGTVLHIESMSGKEDAREFLGFINSFVTDGSYLLVDKPVTVREEKQWIRTQIQAQRKAEQI